jgi:hypothetical protein
MTAIETRCIILTWVAQMTFGMALSALGHFVLPLTSATGDLVPGVLRSAALVKHGLACPTGNER